MLELLREEEEDGAMSSPCLLFSFTFSIREHQTRDMLTFGMEIHHPQQKDSGQEFTALPSSAPALVTDSVLTPFRVRQDG